MNYNDWVKAIPETITGDALWRVEAYRLGLFTGDLAWTDAAKIAQTRHAASLADQLLRACGSISANIAEGYSRSSGKDQARFYEYALGSAREARDWYYKSRHLLGTAVCDHRLALITQVIRLLLKTLAARHQALREVPAPYETRALEQLLADVPTSE